MHIDKSFFAQHTVEVAKQLLGCVIIRHWQGQEVVVRITETEAYRGADDPASHAHRGITARNRTMFGSPGHLYVYFTYGMHHCMNIVTEPEHTPGAVLIRGAELIQGIEVVRHFRGTKVEDKNLLNGPGKLTQALNIGLEFNEYDLLSNDSPLILEVGAGNVSYQATERIGISKAKDYLWRFVTH